MDAPSDKVFRGIIQIMYTDIRDACPKLGARNPPGIHFFGSRYFHAASEALDFEL